MHHVVSLSGGSASAVAASRVIDRYGKENTTLWFADTLWEDDDLYRFLNDLEQLWDMTIKRHTEGRTPLQVAEDRKIIPNSRIAPCSLVLKQQPFKRFLTKHKKPMTVHLGLDWTEAQRMARPKETYEEIEGVHVDYPLTWKPLPNLRYNDTIREWGIEVPRLYLMGFPHNNCGGRCVRQGVKEWKRLKEHFPQRFDDVAEWEQAQRAKGGPRGEWSIAKHTVDGEVKSLTLIDLKRLDEDSPQLGMFEAQDSFGCFCAY
jgi:3'-phosphoadenosine 5'-phosphosulfate sulfotransferase (PAPS reductase)/FAD synthetase